MLKCKSKITTLILALSMVLVNITGVMAQEEYVTCLRNASGMEVGTTPAWAVGGKTGESSMAKGAKVEVVADEGGTEKKVLKVDSSYKQNTLVYNCLRIHSDKAFNLADGDVTIVMRAKTSSNMNGNDFFRVFGTTEEDTSTELIGGGMYVGGTNVTLKDNPGKTVLPASTFSSDTYLYFRQTISDGQYTLEYSTDGTTYKGTQSHTYTTYPEIINGIYFLLPYAATDKSFYIDFVEFKQKAPKTLVVTDSIPTENKTLYGNDAVIRFNYEVSSVGIEDAVEVTKGSDVLTYGSDYTLSAQNNDVTVHFVNPGNGVYSVKVNDLLNYNQTGFATPNSGYEKTISFNIENSDDLYIGFGNYFAEDVPKELVCKTYLNGNEYSTNNFVINKSVQSDENTQSGKAAYISWEGKNNTGATGKISIPFGKEYKTAAGDITVIMRAKVKSANAASYTKFMGLGGKAGEESITVGGLYVGGSSVVFNGNPGLSVFSTLDSFASDQYVYFKQVVSGDQYTCMTSTDGITWSAGKTATISNGLDTISSIDFTLPSGNHASEFYIDFANVIYEPVMKLIVSEDRTSASWEVKTLADKKMNIFVATYGEGDRILNVQMFPETPVDGVITKSDTYEIESTAKKISLFVWDEYLNPLSNKVSCDLQ